jgi:hypothetical protein
MDRLSCCVCVHRSYNSIKNNGRVSSEDILRGFKLTDVFHIFGDGRGISELFKQNRKMRMYMVESLTR